MTVALAGLALGPVGDGRYATVLVAHVALLSALTLALRRDGGVAAGARAWLPLVAIPLLYAELPYLMDVLGAPYGDPLVQRWEGALWNGQPSRTLARTAPWRWLSESLHLAYLSYYAIIYVPLALLWRRSRASRKDPGELWIARGYPAAAFGEASTAVMLTFIVCFVVFVAFPVQGPRYLWTADAPDGPVRRVVLAILEQGSSRGAAFPSSHMAVAVVQSLMALRWRVPGRSLVAVLTAALGVGAVYGGFHYAIDMVAGAIAGVLVFLAVSRWGRPRVNG